MPEINFPYTAVELTEEINRIPNTYGLLNELDLFPSQGIASTLVEIRFEDGVLHVLPRVERGGAPTEAERGKGKAIYLEVPHFPHQDVLKPKDLENMLRLRGGALRRQTADDLMAKRLDEMRGKHAITREYLRTGALKGTIVDGAAKTIYDLFDVFGIVKKTVDFVLGTGTTDIIAKCEEVRDHIITNLKGESMTGVEVIVSSSFFNKFVQHAEVEKFWLQTQGAQELIRLARDTRGNNWGRVFEFQEITFREYKGVAPLKSGSVPFVAAGYGHAYPAGTMNAFATYDGPAYHWDFIDDPGIEMYISTKILDHGQGVELVSQSNPLPVCKRPELLVEVSTSN